MFRLLRYFGSSKSSKNDPKVVRCSHRVPGGRKTTYSSLRIREITVDDSGNVCKLLFDHFRSLTFPAIIYWVVQHIHDIVVIIAINSFMLPLRNLFYFCLLFSIYLYIRARYEIEKHIRRCCPDLVDVYGTYRTTSGSNFWVGCFSEHDEFLDSPSIQSDPGSRKSTINSESGVLASQRNTSNEQCDKAKENDTNVYSDKIKGDGEGRPILRFRRADSLRGPENYRSSSNDILLRTKCKENEILGCIGITPYRNASNIAQMVRLVVSSKCRNMGVGSLLLRHLELYAVNFGYTEIRVFTNNLNTAYLHFLKQNGFEIVQIVRRGLMRGDLIIWNKILKQPDGLITGGQSSKVSDATFIPE